MQYLDYKERYPDCLLFFQVGDFYELFFDDAVTVARTINLTLTSRDKNNPNPVPMCGVPLSVADNYAERLVQQGFSVAIVSQSEAPTGKGMVARKLERIITPGIKVLGAVDSEGAAGHVAAVHIASSTDLSIAFTDVQSGSLYIREGLALEDLYKELSRINICEVVLPKMLYGKPLDKRTHWVRLLENIIPERSIKFRTDASVVLDSGNRQLGDVAGYKSLSPTGKKAASFLVAYIDEITVNAKLRINAVKTVSLQSTVGIDATTRLNLELVQNSKDASTRGTLYEYLNKTVTPGGARLLRESVIAPVVDKKIILSRQGIIEEFLRGVYESNEVRRLLGAFPDLERIATRIELAIVSPREVGALRDALLQLPELLAIAAKGGAKEILTSTDDNSLRKIGSELDKALVELPPLSTVDGGVFKEGFSAELDRLIEVSTKGKEWIAELEVKEREASGIPSLKIRYNNVFGYFIEVTNTHLSKVPTRYTRKQTTSNSERYITEELKVREEEVLGASEKRIALEKKLFDELRVTLAASTEIFRQLGKRIALFDMLCGFAVRAAESSLVKPIILDDPIMVIKQGKHPQLAEILGAGFIPNDVILGGATKGCAIITGPNMGGKSTYLRQAALITVMAQLGSFVPAESAEVGLVDKIFARLGASDNISEGESTFMVEMREAATILESATEHSLLLIDEIGRGTATADGLALAQAILEWIITKTQGRTLFATHFHELTSLEAVYPKRIKNLSVGSIEEEGRVLFTHQIAEGPADRSYGVEVARLAGLPEEIIARAEDLLKNAPQREKKAPSQQAFAFAESSPRAAKPSDYDLLKKLQKKVQEVEVNETTPLGALSILNDLKQLLCE